MRSISAQIAAMAAMVAAAAAAVGNSVVTSAPKVLAMKTHAPSVTHGGKGYGRMKLSSTAAFRRHATKVRNQHRYRVACR